MKKTAELMIALLLAGSLFLLCGRVGRVREGVVVGGVEVGNMTYEEAEEAVRATLHAPFILQTPVGTCTAELCYKDDVSTLVRRAKKGESLTPHVRREWPDAELFLQQACEKCAVDPVNATLSFSKEGFVYTKEQSGVFCDYASSLRSALEAVEDGTLTSTLVTHTLKPSVTQAQLRENTKLLSSFTTSFDATKRARVHNISLACSRISGSKIMPGEEFSFNDVVGRRTRENGFQDAAVIQNGVFVQGTGGGVCQVSTTLMGAALRSGLRVTESHPHSLLVGYVPPSQDAMVSRYSDLKFFNPHSYPVYILGKTGENSVTFSIYGRPDGMRYEIVSNITARVEPPPAEVREGSEDKILRAEKSGMKSESYLLCYDGTGRLTKRKLLRRDSYAAVRGIVVKRAEEQDAP